MASGMDFSYQYFLSRVDFVAEAENIGQRWGTIPLLDFIASMKFLRGSVEWRGEGVIDFTENDHVVRFGRRDDGAVEVEDSWASGVLVCGEAELMMATTAFIETVLRDLSAEFPAIQSNAFFLELSKR
jgi:hypothetical protein